MSKSIHDEKIDYLFEGILCLKSAEECYSFFEDLCTVAELLDMSRRFHAARMLSENRVYTEITEQTGLSAATISRVNRCLKYGADGYSAVLERLREKGK